MKIGFLIICFFVFPACFIGSAYATALQDTISVKDSSRALNLPVDSLSGRTSVQSAKTTSQAYSFDSVFKPYKSFIKSTSVESTTNLDVNNQRISYKTDADFATKFTLNNVALDKRIFNVSVVKLNTKVETMGLQLEYNSDSTQNDTTSGFAKPLFDLVGKNIRLDVDTTGKILNVDSSQLSENISDVLSSFSVNRDAYKAGDSFGLLYNKDLGSLQLGSAWTDSLQNTHGKTVSKYVVQSLLRNEIILLVQGDIIQSGTFWNNGHAFKTDFTGTQSGKIIISKDTRLIKQRTIVYNLRGTVHYSDRDIPATAISRINETLNPS